MMKMVRLQRNTIFAKPTKVYGTLIVTLVVFTLLYFVWIKPNEMGKKQHHSLNFLKETYSQNDLTNENSAFKGEKIVHLDLKGAPPKVAYYGKLFPLLKKLGATGILMEYEDMFPYSGPLLKNVSALNCYSLEDIKTINRLAMENNLSIIPLIQTFGHLEFLLKLPKYKKYREVSIYPQSICPTYKNTLDLLTDMAHQMVLAHPMSNMIHIGADEVYHLGVCDRCSDAMFRRNITKSQLFLKHVTSLAGRIKGMYPELRVLMWDDHFRSMTLEELQGLIVEYVEPVIWKYSKDVYYDLGPSLWNTYSQSFKKVWAASAFKGATGSNQFVLDATHYIQNNRGWMSIIAEYKAQVHFQGIILTGWQRYDHFAVLCELLPVGIPALAMSLRLLAGYNDSPLSPPTEVAKVLRCEQPYALIGPAFGSPQCYFPGSDVLEQVLRLQQLKQEYETIIEDSRVKGWLSEYNIAHSYSSPFYIASVTTSVDRIKNELNQVDQDMNAAMSEVYDNFTIDEWKQTYIKPLEDKVNILSEARKTILAKDTWPRRPLKHDEV